MAIKTGVLLMNLGTPDDTTVGGVRRYLRQFLSDKRVLDVPTPIRLMLLNLVILPFRPKQSAEAYRTIWDQDRGSPLKYHTEDLTDAVRKQFGDDVSVKYAMRYQNPSVTDVFKAFKKEGVEQIIVLPMFPQYASSSAGSGLEEVYRVASKDWNVPYLTIIPPYYDHPGYLEALETVTRDSLGDLDQYDFFLISFHGVPEKHVTKSDLTDGGHCLAKPDCCEQLCDLNRFCYRAQSVQTARRLAERMGIPKDRYEITFQSRLGPVPWIRPYTDEVLKELPGRGVKRLAVIIPSFTADCLETIEEIGDRGKEDFLEAGGEAYAMATALNAHPAWVDVVAGMVRAHLAAHTPQPAAQEG